MDYWYRVFYYLYWYWLKTFAGSESGVIYVKSEFSFGSMTLIGSFLVMTILVFILGNYLIDSVVKRLNKK
jgi:hypothetical protein